MVRYLIRFGYLGTKYRGLQKIPKFREETIQGVMEMALENLKPLNTILTVTCSRTDKGVHAIQNAIHVDLDHKTPGEIYQPQAVTEKLNIYMTANKHDIIVTKTCIVPDTFHVRFHTRWRSYKYRIALLKSDTKPFSLHGHLYEEFLPINERNRCHILHGSLEPERIQDVMELFVGTHDFTTFTRNLQGHENKSPIRTVYDLQFYPSSNPNLLCDPQYENIDFWEFFIRGDSFLYNQVRKMIGTFISVGYGIISPDDLKVMLKQPSPDRWRKSVLAPACGLYLFDVSFHPKCFFSEAEDSVLQYSEGEEE